MLYKTHTSISLDQWFELHMTFSNMINNTVKCAYKEPSYKELPVIWN